MRNHQLDLISTIKAKNIFFISTFSLNANDIVNWEKEKKARHFFMENMTGTSCEKEETGRRNKVTRKENSKSILFGWESQVWIRIDLVY